MRNIALWHGDESTYIKYDSEFGKVIKCNVLHLPGEERFHRVNSAKETLVEERKWISMESINTMHKHLSRVFKKQNRSLCAASQITRLENKTSIPLLYCKECVFSLSIYVDF